MNCQNHVHDVPLKQNCLVWTYHNYCIWRENETIIFLLATVILPEAHLSVCKLLHQFYSSLWCNTPVLGPLQTSPPHCGLFMHKKSPHWVGEVCRVCSFEWTLKFLFKTENSGYFSLFLTKNTACTILLDPVCLFKIAISSPCTQSKVRPVFRSLMDS